MENQKEEVNRIIWLGAGFWGKGRGREGGGCGRGRKGGREHSNQFGSHLLKLTTHRGIHLIPRIVHRDRVVRIEQVTSLAVQGETRHLREGA